MKKYCLILISFLLLAMTCSCEKNEPVDEPDTMTIEFLGNTIKMIYCPGGTYLTNADDSDPDFEDGPEVTVDPFWISETEVPNDLLVTVLKVCNGVIAVPGAISGGTSIFDTEENTAHNYLCEDYVKWGWQPLIYMGGSQLYGLHDIIFNDGFDVRGGLDNYPSTDITWYGAIMACNWLTFNYSGASRVVYSGIDTDDEWWDDETICDFNENGFRLPTSAEWECAARWQGDNSSGECYEYPAGSGQYWTRGGCASGASALTSDVNATAAVAVYEYDSDGFTNPDDIVEVKGDRKPNILGLYDMSGNVWEWCFDDAGSYHRLIRGGSAQSKHHDVRIISTWDYPADGTASDLGFRLVMSTDD
jgi:formylglycine-generating enzyme required for sulfatase activity